MRALQWQNFSACRGFATLTVSSGQDGIQTQESDVDTQLKKYRFGNGVLLSTEQEDEIERLSYYPVFQNATADNPVAALDFCANLECSIVVAFLREHGHYRDFSTVEERLTPRVRFPAFYAVSRAVDIMSAYRSTCVDEGLTCLLVIRTVLVWSPEERVRVSLDPLSFLFFIALPSS